MRKTYLAKDGAKIEISSFGGHLLSWKDGNLQEFLYLSPLAVFDDKTPIRGGVPICFPKFGSFDGKNEELNKLTSHGFLRQVIWQFDADQQVDDCYGVELSYYHNNNQANFEVYPHIFKAILTIKFNNTKLNMELKIQNLDTKSMEYTLGFHPYFAFNIDNDELHNLQNLPFDSADNTRGVIKESVYKITKETNLVFKQIAKLPILKNKDYTLHFSCINMEDLVLWNPYTSNKIKDLQENSYHNFVCIEPVCVNKNHNLQANEFASYGFNIVKI